MLLNWESSILRGTISKWFPTSVGMIYGVTGLAKVWAAFGNTRILALVDPILGIQFSHLLLLVGVVELVIALFCLFRQGQMLTTIMVAWLSTILLVYRLGLWWSDWQRPCPCLGNLTDALHILPQTADMIMKIILAYLLTGSYASLFCLWRQHKKKLSAPLPAQ